MTPIAGTVKSLRAALVPITLGCDEVVVAVALDTAVTETGLADAATEEAALLMLAILEDAAASVYVASAVFATLSTLEAIADASDKSELPAIE